MPFQSWRDVSKEQVLFVLTSLKTFFADQSKWIEHPEAIDEHGKETEPLNEAAVKFSLMGASFKIAVEKYGTPLANYIDCAARDYLSELNDEEMVGQMLSYDTEFALISLAIEELSK